MKQLRTTTVMFLIVLAAGCATAKKEEPPKELTPREKQEKLVTDLQQAVQADAGNPELHYKLGNALFDLARYVEAMNAYQKAITLNPEYAAAYCNMGLTLRLLGQLDPAIDTYERAITLEPQDQTSLTNLIAALRAKGDLDTAVTHLQRLAELRPQDVAVRSELANILFRKDDFTGAEKLFKEVIALDPGRSSDYYNLGLCYTELGRLDEALTTWLTALAYDDKNAAVRKGLAVLYWKRGEYDKAWQAVVDCQTRNIPLDPAFMENLQRDSGHAGPEAAK